MDKKPNKPFDMLQLQDLLAQFKRTMSQWYKKETSSLHCSLSHLEVLQFIAERRNPTMKDIAAFLQITPPSVTTIIDSMVESGLVKRDTAAGDRRSIRVVLTTKATKMQQALQKKKKHLLATLLKKLSDEQKVQLSDIIRTLIT